MLRRLLTVIAVSLIPVLVQASELAGSSKKSIEPADRGLSRIETPRDSRKRIALVVGNSQYASSPLKNPVNDARAMAATLRRLGFEVDEQINLGYMPFNEAIEAFGNKLKPGGIGLFYYAGHGMQVQGANYLIPVDATIRTENEVRYKAIDAGLILAKMESAKSDVNIVVLDACRDNPFARSFRSASKGLAQIDAPTGTIIAYATSPGKTASDGKGKNGAYTEALIQAMESPDLKVEEVFKRVRKLVLDKTNSIQVPWESTSLVGDFRFIRTASSASSSQQSAQAINQPSPPSKEAEDLDELIARAKAEERAKREDLERITADLAKYEKIVTSSKGSELRQVAWKALSQKYPEANRVPQYDITAFLAQKGLYLEDGRVVTAEQKKRIEAERTAKIAQEQEEARKKELLANQTTVRTGNYHVQGKNPNGSSYSGTVVISKNGDTYFLAWKISSSTYSGSGTLADKTLTVEWGDSSPVIYHLENDGRLVGTWAKGTALETLTPLQ
ncbi:LIC10280 family protein [Trichlorobacter lovleyi]|uniref:LIC10280 family protein n=1 Tax=Trichlorobacter lovleyi TaxID=313985 RepID=UPI003D0F2221